MHFSELMAVLSTLAIRLQMEDGDLVILGDDAALDDELWDSLVRHKAQLLELVAEHAGDWSSPAFRITPDMLPLVDLDQAAIKRIVATVPGGAANVQDIYPLAPLQEGMLYHHLSAQQGDPYVLQTRFAFDCRARFEAFAQALQWTIDRHDILRTAMAWESLDSPLQVVWRQARLVCEEIVCDPLAGEVLSQLQARHDARHYRLDLQQAPLLRLVFAEDPARQRVVALLLSHHTILDHSALDVVREEILAHMQGRAGEVPVAVPFRNYLAKARMGQSDQVHEAFFRDMLGDIDEPTLPFGLRDVQGDSHIIDHLRAPLDSALSLRLRDQARQLGVSAASLMHLAWALVLGQLCGRDVVVFGTVLLGRMQAGEGADRALGMFINTLPLRVDLGHLDVRAGVRATHARLSTMLNHEHASLALAQRCSGVTASTPLFNAILNYRHSAAADLAEVIELAEGVQVLGSDEGSNYPLTFNVDDLGEGFTLTLMVERSIGVQRITDYLHTTLQHVVEALEQTPSLALRELSMVPEAERESLLRGFNAHQLPFPKSQAVHRLFEARVASQPDAVALTQGGQGLSYGALNAQANQLAHHLLDMGVKPDDRVALCVQRGPAMLVGMLGILKAGAGYVPLDPGLPEERLRYLLEDSAPRALLTQGALLGQLPTLDVALIDLDHPLWRERPSTDLPLPALTSAHLAYVIYTSGSTGLPKGVMVEHRTLENLVHWHNQAFDQRPGSQVSSVAGFGFDAMAWEVWPSLCAGATLHLPPREIGNEDIQQLLAWWQAQPLEVSFLPTPVAEYAFSQHLQHPTLKTLLIGGDRLRQFNQGQTFAVINNYGPTEATVVATSGTVQVGQALHIGRPIANAQVYLLDEQLRPVPVGVAGELYIGGAGVARGYLNRPQMTAERFLDDPFSNQPRARMYRTGDLARWLADGTLDYLGRNDDQVKIRGMRIELAEIEARLALHPEVESAVVLAREDGPGHKRLVAYYRPQLAPSDLDNEALRAWLHEQLPEYMLPVAYVALADWPLTANGKLDRKALPAPGLESFISRDFEAPLGPVETALAQIWKEVLKVEQVGRHDNFFELGGHSLLAVSLIERMRQVGLGADVRILFSQPTLAALATAVGSGREVEVPANRIALDCQRITPDLLPLLELSQEGIDLIVASVPGGAANVQDIYPLAPLQEGIVYHHLAAGEGDPYLLQTRLAFDSHERLQVFAGVLQQVIGRHDILRTSVLWENLEHPLQVVWRHAELVLQELTPDPASGDVLEQLQQRFDARHYRLDITRAPLIRLVHAWDAAQQRVVAILLFHHLAMDHAALEVVSQEMQALISGQGASLGAAAPYRNYVAQARLGVSQAEHEAFFRQMLGDIDEPTLPFGLQDVQGDGQPIEEAARALEPALNRRLREQARSLGVSVASLMHLAWAQVLGQLGNRRDVVFGTVLLGRMQGGEGADRALGMYINTLPLRVEVGAVAPRAAVKAIHARLSALLGHEHASLALAQRCSGVTGAAPLFSALLNYRHSQAGTQPQAGPQLWDGIDVLGGEEHSNYPLTLSVNDRGDSFGLSVLSQAPIDPQRICGYMHTALEHLVQALEQGSAVTLDQLSILPVEERQQLLHQFNPSPAHYPRGQTIHGLFEACAAAMPEAPAVIQGAHSLSYGQLNQSANQLAHQLLALGVQPDDRVAISVRRGPDMLLGLLAILKAGAAYVPIDPALPDERQHYLLQDSAPVALLTQGEWLGRWAATALPLIDLDQRHWLGQPRSNPQLAGLTPAHLAYVIYTSGSTGLPKGVMVEHRTLENLVHWHNLTFDQHPGSQVSSVAGFGFDAMAWEVWPALCVGATLHLPPAEVGNDNLELLLAWWQAQPLEVSFLPTPVAEYAFSRQLQHPTLKTLLIGGDRLRQFSTAQTFAVINNYGPTEATVVATSGAVQVGQALHIGQPVGNARVYLLDEQQRPVPQGVVGELYIGGAGVARGYLNRPQMSAERFMADPFSAEPEGRMYRSGDLARWRADGNLDYLGRNDDQVKVRGVRIELGEVESALASHAGVKEAVALVRDARLVVYFTEQAEQLDIEQLHAHLQGRLPDAMVPAAYVRLDALPLTANGKIDRKALPEPGADALLSRGFEAPEGAVEMALAQIWKEVLKVEQVGRHDHFFELGGHSLLAVSLIERMRQVGLGADVRILFSQPTLAALAAAVGSGREVEVPANRIAPGCRHITPDLLPLLDLDQAAIERIVAAVPGGAANVQDIYPLAPLQEGILYHHITAQQGDPYLLQTRLAFDSLQRLQTFAGALQQVIERHDILRSAVFWEGLDTPVQVVLREARLVVEEVVPQVADADVLQQLGARFDARHHRLDLSRAPLIRLAYAQDPAQQRVVVLLMFHHIVLDHTAFDVVRQEMQACLLGQARELGPAMPYRNYVAQARLGVSDEEHEAFFREMLGDIDAPSLPFGLQDVQGDGLAMEEVRHRLPATLSQGLRRQARLLGVSVASLMHLAWARVLAVASGNQQVVFGTVLVGRMQGGEGADRALGIFINTLPLRVDVGEQDARAGVRAVHARLSALLGHEHASLALAQRCSAVAAPLPLFSAILNYRHSAGAAAPLDAHPAWQGMQTLAHDGRSNYPLSLNVDDLGDDLQLGAMTVQQIGAQRVCGYMQTALESLLQALEQRSPMALKRLPILAPAEHAQLLHGFNGSALECNLEQTVHGLFEAQVQRTPDAPALQSGAQCLTYAGLNARANQLARHLRDIGVGPDVPVAICIERSLELVVGLLAILKAGGAYVPLDPAYPPERLGYMLHDSAPAALLVHGATRGLVQWAEGPLIDLEQAAWQAPAPSHPDSADLQVPGLTARHLAYVIYTSGSTGTPKGVMVEHRGLVNLLHWSSGLCPGAAQGSLLQKTPLSFDASVWEVFWPLTSGMRLVLARPDGHREPRYLAQLIREQRISVIQFVPAMLQLFLELDEVSQCSSLTDVFCGGGELGATLARRFQARLPGARLHNVYGPTEATVDSTVWTLEPGATVPALQLPIGRPIANTRLYVLDAEDQPVPVGASGQLHIGGAGVARGYLGLPGLLAERFIDSPFVAGDRLYRTGDLVRYHADGNLEFLGRNDFQVKLHGLRIELGEIQEHLERYPGIRQAVALVREDVPGDKRLVAYFSTHPESTVPEVEALRQHLLQQLPEYMVPGLLVPLPALPLTPNGKLDRQALPVPDSSALLSRAYEAPQGEIETVLARIWAEVLKVEQVGRHDHFFELGGHSLLAVSLIERMRQVGLSADVRILFSQPTLAALAAAVGSGREVEVPANRIALGCQRITPDLLPLLELDQDAIDLIVASVPGGAANVQDIYPLAPLQEGILYHHLMAEQGDPYLLQSQMAFDSVERLQLFARALQHVIERHDILRTSVLWQGLEQPLQVVWRHAELHPQEVVLDAADGDVLGQLQQRFDARHYRLDMTRAPLIQLLFAKDPQQRRVVATLLFHHLAMDHTALEVVGHELSAFLAGQGATLGAAVPYRNYVAQARLGASEQEHEAFFRDMLGDVDEPTLPFGLQDVQGDGRDIEEVSQRLEADLSGRIRSQARGLGVSAASLFHLAWARVLSVTSGQRHPVFGTVLMGRMQGGEGADRALGMFINTLPLRVDIDATSVRDGVRATHARLSALLGHEHASLALAQRCSQVAAPLPLFSAMLNYRHSAQAQSVAQAPWQGIHTLASEERSNYPLSLNIDDLGQDFRLNVMTPARIGAERVCGYMRTALESLVQALEQAPHSAVEQLSILPAAERRQLLGAGHGSREHYAVEQTLHGLFETQVLRTPDAVAVRVDALQLSYRQLNARANQVAHRLLGLGVQPDDRVAICVERGLEMIVGLLGILKAGAGYVPIDPGYPGERIAYTLADSAPLALLVQGATQALVGECPVPRIDLDSHALRDEPQHNPQLPGLKVEHLAYVIYTSGSTGLPKGVMVEHRQVTRLFAATQGWFGFNRRDVWALFHSFAFDFSVWEIYGALLHGGQLLVVPQRISRSPDECYELLCDAGVSILNQTPSAFRQLIAAQGRSDRKHSLRQVIFGGEALDPGMLKPWYERVGNAGTRLVNMYGITETTVHVTYRALEAADALVPGVSPIGGPIPDLQLYLLDPQREPVPVGVVGELYVGGAGVARGYLNREALSAERFIADPFHAGSGTVAGRLYKTGDLGRWLADGSLEYLGRNDDQVKIRGFRIELGEIQAQLAACEGVREALVIAREDEPGERRLVAYLIAEDGHGPSAAHLREQLLGTLAEYMLPSAFVLLPAWPLTGNGKLDRKALPMPDDAALARRGYQAPQGEVEQRIASLWQDLLKVERVGRHDNFFELGGHSLLAVKLMERMRQAQLRADIRVLFSQPTLAALAAAVGGEPEVQVPANLIGATCTAITPDMLPLADLDPAAIERVLERVPGGVDNVQDIYALAPLQAGILYHHLSSQAGDPYLLQLQLGFSGLAQVKAFIDALQGAIARHDILRTSLVWDCLDEPVQVVWRQAPLAVERVASDPQDADVLGQLQQRFDPRHYRLDLGQASMMRFAYARDEAHDRWLGVLLLHHILLDHTSLAVLVQEMSASLGGQAGHLAPPVQYRNYVAQARLGVSQHAHEAFFQQMLGDIHEPTLPFGLQDVQGDGSGVQESHLALEPALCRALREQARRLGVSAASLVHLAWAQVLGQVSGQDEVVFGTVLLGRMQGGEGADRALGMFINTLPLRVSVGALTVLDGVRATHERLAQLLGHEHAPLSLAQRCSGVPASTPLFSTLLNYRHSAPGAEVGNGPSMWDGIEVLNARERSNYPLVLNVDDLGELFELTVQALAEVEGARIGEYMRCALHNLVHALEQAPATPLQQLSIVAPAERERVLHGFNATARAYPAQQTVHGLFEAQVQASPQAVAAVHGEQVLSYAELNRRANRLAHGLLQMGVQAGDRVAMLLPRSVGLLVSQLAISKCAAVYVPLDVNAPAERQLFILADSAARLLLTQSTEALACPTQRIDLDRLDLEHLPSHNPDLAQSSESAVYLMYTSGSTGTPKGVLVPHRAVSRLVLNNGYADFTPQDRVAFASNPAFDASTLEVWAPLLNGGRVVVVDQDVVLSSQALGALLQQQKVSVLWMTAGLFQQHADGLLGAFRQLRYLMVGGDVLDPSVIARVLEHGAPRHLLNGYGPTEATTFSTTFEIKAVAAGGIPIGRPIGNSRAYVLDARQQPVAVGVVGELYIGGAGVALGYLNQPQLTAQMFIVDPFADAPQGLMYRTGDLACWRADGVLLYQGRNDQQVKLRGFRIELGEIETRIAACTGVREAALLVREDAPGDKRLVAYCTPQVAGEALDIEALHGALQGQLPDYMLPAAYVQLERLPLTANGKLDRKALPAPDASALLSRAYEAPLGEVEITLARIWAEVLKVEQVGRHDHFFELGGHSLLAVSLIERMRQVGLSADVRVLFNQPTLAALAAAVGSGREIEVPANRIALGCQRITPDLLPLLELSQEAIDLIVASVPGGAANVQDIYPLAPLQEGILYHHISAGQGDPYLLQSRLSFDSLERLQAFAEALQQVIARHDILRTSVLWEGLEHPVQVVWRHAELHVQAQQLDPAAGDIVEQLQARFDARHHRLDLAQAPLMRLIHAEDPQHGRVVSLLLFHHLALDHTAMEVVGAEMRALLLKQPGELGTPMPYRNYVAQALLGAGEHEHEAFFRDMLGDVEEPTLPFGLQDVQGDGLDIDEAHWPLPAALSQRLREQARTLGVSAASLMHLAWAQVLGRLCDREDVVFGTVLMGRMQGGEGADRALGVFINTLPLRVTLGETGVRDGVRAVHRRLSALLGHEHASLALAQRCSRVAVSAPLFSALLNYRHSAHDGLHDEQAPWAGIELLGGEERSNYPLSLSVDDLGQGFALSVLAVAHLEPQRICGYMHTALEHLAQALEQNPGLALNRLPILPEAERRQLLETFNANRRHYPRGQTLHGLFEARVAETPDALAMIQGPQQLSYRQLNQQANQLARHLLELGVQPDDRVAICVRRGPAMLVGMLGILKAGAAYVPLDPALPRERLRYLLEDSAPLALVTQGALLGQLPTLELPLIDLDQSAWHNPALANPQLAQLTPAHLAYVIYTSGSTGLPKGVMVEHRTLENLVHWHNQAFDQHSGSQVSSVAGFGFDAMAWEVWPALCVGATLHLPPPDVGNENIEQLLAWWQAQPLTVSFLPTPVAEYAFSQHLHHPTLKTLLIGGDRLRQFPRTQSFAVINNYGPTEATVVATSGAVQVGQALHIGTPMANARVYLLDRQQRPVPVGVAGELYVGGAGVARGYLNRPQMTAERFLADPFSREPQARMYRTGDLARWQADGTLDYLGRNDDQVKIRGMRIELGEIESALARHPGLNEAVVLARQDESGQSRLVAYFTAAEGLDIEALRSGLQASLPGHMVPLAYVQLPALPLTANGKLDRKALPEPAAQHLLSREYQAPQGAVEMALAQIWQEVLKVEQVGRHDHFFELGGHSLLAVSLIERMRQAGLGADVRVLFSQPTLAALAAAVGSGREVQVPDNLIPGACPRITPDMLPLVELDQATLDGLLERVPGGAANVQDIYPLAPLQEGILYHHITARQGDPYLLQSHMAFADRALFTAFTQALQQVIARHDILRTGVFWEGLQQPLQVVLRNAELVVHEERLDPSAGDILGQLHGLCDARHHRMDITRAPLMRVHMAQDPVQGRIVAVVLFHHLALDHTAMDVVGHELRAFLQGQGQNLGTPVPYRNYVAQARLGVSEQEHEAFFRDMLGDVDEPTLPFDLQDVQGDGGGIEERSQALPSALSARLRHQARLLGVSAASLFHLAWARVLGATSGKQAVVFGTVLLGRMQGGEGADRALGMFINTLPLRVEIDATGVRDGVRATHRRLSALLGHEHASLALAQRCSGVAAPLPLFSAMLNYRHSQDSSAPTAPPASAHGIETLAGEERTNYPLSLNVDDRGEGFSLTAMTPARIGAQRICGYMQTALESLADALERAPDMALNRLPILTGAERQHLLLELNATEVAYPLNQTLHGLFEAQVERSPQAPALLAGGQQLSYRQLNLRANQLAHHLRRQGVGPDTRVAICVERGLEMVIGLLAILKAGGAYVPIDPSYPAERIAYMLEDSAPVVVLVQAATQPLVTAGLAPLLVLDQPLWPAEALDNPQLPELHAGHLAYVIYTSGSTGQPKGVMNEHGAVVNRLLWMQQAYGLTAADAVLQKTPFSFDVSVWEFFWPLLTGARLVMARPEGHKDPAYLCQVIQAEGISTVHFVPSMLDLFLAHGAAQSCRALVRVLCSGEALPGSLVRRFKQQLPGSELHNLYGPTEAAVDVTAWNCAGPLEQTPDNTPIGKPIANTRLYLLDEQMQPVPQGVVGELYIGGVQVARGYLNRGQLNAERFLVDPFSPLDNARMYRTGDVARYRADGNIEYLGRNDDQVKLRGLRIELGEIQARLTQLPEVREAVVLAREDVPGDKRLVAYYSTHETGSRLEVEALRGELLQHLPEYMVPALYVHLQALPLSPNGKLDRKALPAPGLEAAIVREYEAPQGDTEILLARLWAQLLNVERVGRHDNFFELGGHSLLAVSLIGRLHQEGMEADVRALFEHPTLAGYAAITERMEIVL
ncbi:non-ribosomal peptide synthase/polyketide synthase [Pseudomonas sp. TH07]|uniref:non-ribosomal peptide synthase/polyketide synthase n=1 Tax=Pseudomonas sp. TH07 TaxID=2796373 RepID=UPI001912ADE3|nr:non-ribosomal peptide synthase/polyketide synthase [Pseudomonas sp. TH07]MBK5540913.1 non-ribosomal peptide synthase/polyketide synthase [Pseudomonas sp. TH07]